MAKQASRMMIGGFVVIALFILAASLAVFGSGKFFTKTQRFVLYFDESVKGLNVGAPVLFQGVAVGTVRSISIVANPGQQRVLIPVIIEIELDRFNLQEAGKTVDPKKNMPRLIERGLRAVLTMQSLITGNLLIEVDLFPNTPVNLKNIDKDYVEIPTIPSTTARLARALDRLDLDAIIKKLDSSLDGITKLVNNPDLAPSIQSLKETLQSARKLITRMDGQVDPLAKNVIKTAQNFGRAAKGIDSRAQGLSDSLEKTLSNLDKTLSGFDKTMTAVRGVVSQDAPAVVNLESTLKEISAMSRSLRELADLLEQQPESLLRGKKKTGGQ